MLKGSLIVLFALIEIGIITLVILRIRKLVIKYRLKRKENFEPYFALRLAFSEILFSPLAEFISNDIWLFYSVLSFPFKKKSREDGKRFTYHKESFYPTIFALVLSLMIFEGIVVHLILIFTLPRHLWWIYLIVLLLNIYAIVWLTGDYINISRRPHVLEKNNLLLRLGIRLSGIIDYSNISLIQSSERIPPRRKKRDKDTLFITLRDKCNVYLELKKPMDFYSFFSFGSGIEKIFLYLDKPNDFINEVRGKTEK